MPINNFLSNDNSKFRSLANAIRFLSVDAVEKAKSGHPGMPMGIADVVTSLFFSHLKHNPQDPNWVNRDRFILSAGHGSMLLYSLLYLTGYKDCSLDNIKNFRQLHSVTSGHPEQEMLNAVEVTTGPLGQGIANAVGIAIIEQKLRHKIGKDLIDHKTYVLAGDGCLMEGISYEAISLAGHLKLSNLILLWDNNGITIDGKTSLTTSENQIKRLEAAGWDTIEVDGHNSEEIDQAINFAKSNTTKPTFISCKTIIGYGSVKANSNKAHGSPLGSEEIKELRKTLSWDFEPFEIPADILETWQNSSNRSLAEYNQWQDHLTKTKGSDNSTQFLMKIIEGYQSNDNQSSIKSFFQEYDDQYFNTALNNSSRAVSGEILNLLNTKIDNLIGGSADLSNSNNTISNSNNPIFPEDNDTQNINYIFYGIREHAMAAIMNGIASYQQSYDENGRKKIENFFLPYGGTFLIFSDYARAAIRLSALMKLRVLYIMTHDSIALGEDGPTHQPIEQLASLRSMPGLYVMRPGTLYEILKCFEISLSTGKPAPYLLSLSRQKINTPSQISFNDCNKADIEKGAYLLAQSDNYSSNSLESVTFFATGAELSIALETAKILLEKHNINYRIISVLCAEIFWEQTDDYKNSIINHKDISLKVSIEAASSFGWERFIGQQGLSCAIDDFGLSAPANQIFEYFKLTPEHISKKIINAIQMNKNK